MLLLLLPMLSLLLLLLFTDIEEIDAVVSTLGGSTNNPEVDSQGGSVCVVRKGVRV